MPRKANSWIERLKVYNAGSDEWCVPRRGTSRYDEVMGRVRRNAPSNETSETGRQVRRHRSRSPRHPHGGRIHRSNSPRHPMGRTTIARPKRASRNMNLPKQPTKKELVYDKATGVYVPKDKKTTTKKELVYDKATGLYVPKGTESMESVVYQGAEKKPRKPRAPRQAPINDEMDNAPPLAPADVDPYVPPEPVHRVIPVDHTAPFMDSQIPNRDQLLQRPVTRVVAEVQDVPVIQEQVSGRSINIRQLNINAVEEMRNAPRIPILPEDNPFGVDASGKTAFRRALETGARRIISDAIRARKERAIIEELVNSRPIPTMPITEGVNAVVTDVRDMAPSDVENKLFNVPKGKKLIKKYIGGKVVSEEVYQDYISKKKKVKGVEKLDAIPESALDTNIKTQLEVIDEVEDQIDENFNDEVSNAKSAIQIQSLFRGYVTRIRVAKELRTAFATTDIQRVFRGYLARKGVKTQQAMNDALESIFDELMNERIEKEINRAKTKLVLDTLMEAMVDTQVKKEVEFQVSKAKEVAVAEAVAKEGEAIQPQAKPKRPLTELELSLLKQEEDKKAFEAEQIARREETKRQNELKRQALLATKDKASLTISRILKGMKVRKAMGGSVQQLKAKREAEAQAEEAMKQEIEQLQQQALLEEKNAVTIQGAIRFKLAKKRFAEAQAVEVAIKEAQMEEDNAIKIQSAVRVRQARKKLNALKRRKAFLIKQLEEDKLKMEKAQAKREAFIKQQKQESGALVLQGAMRGRIARKEMEKRRQDKQISDALEQERVKEEARKELGNALGKYFWRNALKKDYDAQVAKQREEMILDIIMDEYISEITELTYLNEEERITKEKELAMQMAQEAEAKLRKEARLTIGRFAKLPQARKQVASDKAVYESAKQAQAEIEDRQKLLDDVKEYEKYKRQVDAINTIKRNFKNKKAKEALARLQEAHQRQVDAVIKLQKVAKVVYMKKQLTKLAEQSRADKARAERNAKIYGAITSGASTLGSWTSWGLGKVAQGAVATVKVTGSVALTGAKLGAQGVVAGAKLGAQGAVALTSAIATQMEENARIKEEQAKEVEKQQQMQKEQEAEQLRLKKLSDKKQRAEAEANIKRLQEKIDTSVKKVEVMESEHQKKMREIREAYEKEQKQLEEERKKAVSQTQKKFDAQEQMRRNQAELERTKAQLAREEKVKEEMRKAKEEERLRAEAEAKAKPKKEPLGKRVLRKYP